MMDDYLKCNERSSEDHERVAKEMCVWEEYPHHQSRPERSTSEDFGFFGKPVICQIYDDDGNLLE